MRYRLLLPDRPSRRSREGTSSHVARASSSGGCCGPTGSKKKTILKDLEIGPYKRINYTTMVDIHVNNVGLISFVVKIKSILV